ncbi:cation-dependent mannose-6-phosphate receptor [Ooceraea biroi]|nr:cation-dependent mannose-6-phosphate receptor [Ooceraea biroi]
MCSRSAIFIALALFVILFCDSTSSECTQVGPCTCLLPDGQYYNLTALAKEKPLNDTSPTSTAIFHPCTNVPMTMGPDSTTCASGSGVSLCAYNKEANKTLNLGTVEETRMKLSSTNKFPIFEIHHGNVTSFINIVCVNYNETSFRIESFNAKEYFFHLSSPYACKIEPQKGLSTGSVLVILFFTFAGIYFIGGAIALKTLRGATGWEMLPNHDFWCELPSLVRDGIVFTFNCCRADSYERI